MPRPICTSCVRRLCPASTLSGSEAVEAHLAHELEVITQAGLANYFLIVWDIVRFSRSQGILCQGRGSAANSLVAYLLDISPIDPLAHDLVFERFLSPERQSTPDIDIDFQADRREEVIQYLYRRYGHEHAAMACTFVTFRARSAVRDVGKALGLPETVIDQAAKALDVRSPRYLADSPGLKDVLGDRQSERSRGRCCWTCVPRSTACRATWASTTAGWSSPGRRWSSASRPSRPRCLTGWWSSGTRSGWRRPGWSRLTSWGCACCPPLPRRSRLVAQVTGERPDLDSLTFDDPAIYDLICAGDTVGCFQVESRAQAQMLPRMRPRCFADLVVAISLIRPGPVQGDMVHPYLRRRLGEEEVVYPHPRLEGVLAETLGVILFQEQVLKVAEALAGFTPGQGELLRRALGRKDGTQAVETFRQAFMAGSARLDVPAEVAADVFERLKAFGLYSFPKSHAAAFAVLVYRSTWLKVYHPVGLLHGAAQQPADGLLEPGGGGQRCPAAWRDGPAGGRQPQSGPLHGGRWRPPAGAGVCQGTGRAGTRPHPGCPGSGTLPRPGRLLQADPAAAPAGGAPHPGWGTGWTRALPPGADLAAGRARLPGVGPRPGLPPGGSRRCPN